MTISSTTNKDLYSGNGSLTVFNYTFRILDEDEILVQLKDTNGVITTQTKTTHYTVSGVGDDAGGAITFVTAPAATDTVILARNVQLLQETDYTENSALPAETLEESFDRLTMINQQQQEEVDRTVKVDSAITGFDATMPDPVADGIIGFNSAADGLDIVTLTDIGSTVISGTTDNGMITYSGTDSLTVESGVTYDGSELGVTGTLDVTGNADFGAGVDVTGNITVTGTVDGVDVAAANVIGRQTIWVPAGAMLSSATSGAAAESIEEATNDINYNVLSFDGTADEYAELNVAFPKGYDLGVIQYQVFWRSTATDTDGVTFALQALARADNEAIDSAWGTAVTVDDANQGAAGELLVSPISGDVTTGAADDDLVFLRLYRDVSDANDTAAEDAQVIGVKIYYDIDTGRDD